MLGSTKIQMRVTLMDMLIVITRECARLTKTVSPSVLAGLNSLAHSVM